jgi:transcriptional regulator with XRE-family HTH domain
VWSGPLIRQARLRRGLSQEALAELLNRDRAQIARWEHGINVPSYETLREVLNRMRFDLPPKLVEMTEEPLDEIRRRVAQTPSERVAEMLELRSASNP